MPARGVRRDCSRRVIDPIDDSRTIKILNVYNRQNACNLVQFEDENGNIVTGQSTGIAFIPLIGIGGRF